MDHLELNDELNELHPDVLDDPQWSIGINLKTYERLYRLACRQLEENGGETILDDEIKAAAAVLCAANGYSWEEIDDERRNTYRSQAKAALTAAKKARVSSI